MSVVALLEENPVVGETRSGPKRFWTGRENLILRNHYPSEGLAGCLGKLPGRTAKAIYQQARLLGIVAPNGGRKDGLSRQRWTASDAIDSVIRQAYPRATHRRDVQKLAQTVGRPGWWVSKRASRLGLVAPRFKAPPWTEAEEAILAEQAHRKPSTLKRLLKGRGFDRSETAIVVKLKRLGADTTDPDHFTCRGFAAVMGVDDKTVSRWILNGLLTARRRGTARVEIQGGDEWWIHRRDARAFIVDNVSAVDIRKVDKHWFVDLLADTSLSQAPARNRLNGLGPGRTP